MRKCKIKEII